MLSPWPFLIFSWGNHTKVMQHKTSNFCTQLQWCKWVKWYLLNHSTRSYSRVIRLDCRTMFLPVYTRKHHKYPILDLRSSKIFILNFEAFSGRYCFIDRRPFQSVKLSSMAMFWFGRYRVWNLCSNDISQDKFWTIWEVLDMLVSSHFL
jgi:hypothetical protein